MKGEKPAVHSKRSIEKLAHFHCGACGKWWSVGDAPEKRTRWFCPWCGVENHFKTESKF